MELKQPIKKAKDEDSELDTASEPEKVKVLTKVNKEMRRQLELYREEVDQLQALDAYQISESYQKLVQDFNSLYDHYRNQKEINRRLSKELEQAYADQKKLLAASKPDQEDLARISLDLDRKVSNNGKLKDPALGASRSVEVSGHIQLRALDLGPIYAH